MEVDRAPEDFLLVPCPLPWLEEGCNNPWNGSINHGIDWSASTQEFDSLAETLMEQLPQRDQLMRLSPKIGPTWAPRQIACLYFRR